jgi:hypothetical protein
MERRALLTRVGPAALLLVLAVVAVVLLAGSGGDDESRLIVKPETDAATGQPGLLVSIEGDAGRDPDFARRPGTVGIQCTDAAGKVTVTGTHVWPWTGDQGLDLPHVHQPSTAQKAAATRRCRLTGTREPLEGEVGE